MENQDGFNESLGTSEYRQALLAQARDASQSPGVYLMKDEHGGVLYVGKAKNLKNRVSSYFQKGPHEVSRTEMLVNRVHRFDVILTETEAEALILECTLIKKHKPKFNVRLKDDKAYPYLKVQMSESYPRIEWTRRVRRDGARYFGPFPSAWSARQVMRLLTESFQLRDCSDNTFRHRSRPCILYQMGKCTAPCVGKISQDQYKELIAQSVAVLEGKLSRITDELRKGMEDSAEREEYEEAASYRDQLQNLELITATQVADEAGSDRNRDVVGIARKDANAHGALLQIRGGRMIAVRHFHLQNTDPSQTDAEILYDFLAQYYVSADIAADKAEQESQDAVEKGEEGNFGAGGPAIVRPSEVLLAECPEDPELLEKTLGVGVRVAETPKDHQLLNVAKTNATYALEQSLKKTGGHGINALEEVQEKLHLPKLPTRIECYDISNTQGDESVASRVVFIDGAPDKNLYRRYKIKTVIGANDFASMKEVLGRRFGEHNAAEELPDLVVVDGGKGQLAQAVAIMDELNVQGVGVVGLAKARTESDFKSSEVKSSFERIFIPNRKNPIPLLPHTPAYKLLTHVRDEAHRFAITYHRLLRSKKSLKSEARK
ncbi:MAG: excinuclease ABC subunit C [Methylotenera sp.]|nr:excinuclease ABC subunit C [Oligoflexia bacterium]